MRKRLLACLAISLLSLGSSWGQRHAPDEAKPSNVAPSGDSALEAKIGGRTVRVVVSTEVVDLGSPRPARPPDGEAKTNCTYSRFPCTQITNLRIWIDGRGLLIPRSVFADCSDIGNMSLTKKAGIYVLELVGGDASEGYSVKVFFGSGRVKRREVYSSEASALLEATTYEPPIVLN